MDAGSFWLGCIVGAVVTAFLMLAAWVWANERSFDRREEDRP